MNIYWTGQCFQRDCARLLIRILSLLGFSGVTSVCLQTSKWKTSATPRLSGFMCDPEALKLEQTREPILSGSKSY